MCLELLTYEMTVSAVLQDLVIPLSSNSCSQNAYVAIAALDIRHPSILAVSVVCYRLFLLLFCSLDLSCARMSAVLQRRPQLFIFPSCYRTVVARLSLCAWWLLDNQNMSTLLSCHVSAIQYIRYNEKV